MPRKQHVFLVDQHRDSEAVGHNTIGDLPDLFLRMSARVTRVGSEISGRNKLNAFHGTSLSDQVGSIPWQTARPERIDCQIFARSGKTKVALIWADFCSERGAVI